MPLEIVRLPVPEGAESEVAGYLAGAAYFRQPGLLSHRILVGADAPEVALILEWESRERSRAALESETGRAFLAGLEARLAGAPDLAYYEPHA